MSAFLPQHDPDRPARTEQLEQAQKEYTYCYTHVSPLAIIDRVPFRDEFSFGWLKAVAERVIIGLANRAELEVGAEHRDYHLAKHSFLSRCLEFGEEMVAGIRHVVTDALKFDGRIGAEPLRPQSLEDFAELFRHIGLPPVARDYRDDRNFAWMRVGGPNPLMIRRMIERDERLPLTELEFQRIVPADSFEAALAEGRLYLADYAALDGAELGIYPHGPKYIYAPLALFVIEKTTRKLLPVAIQCRQKPGADNPIFTPQDGHNWLIAKTTVEIADGNYHEAFSHLGRTHLFLEPFVISARRQLAANHPLHILLDPHFEGTLAINEAAWQHLVANKGAVDKLFGGSIKASRGLAVQAVQSAQVAEMLLPRSFAMRGVCNLDEFPEYPYRDDAMLYWEAIGNWVTDYVRAYYQYDADLQDDEELRNWLREVSAQDGGRIAGLPTDGNPATIDNLIELLTLIIFTCSVQHAAVNFPQYDLMSYVPMMPLASYAPAPTSKGMATEADYMAMLPPLDMAELQVELGYMLGSVYYTQLGQYAHGHFADVRLAEPLVWFQKRISEIGATIAQRNMQRRPYQFLAPTGIPQSINI
jgi:arachidonate 15-lipoxygenase